MEKEDLKKLIAALGTLATVLSIEVENLKKLFDGTAEIPEKVKPTGGKKVKAEPEPAPVIADPKKFDTVPPKEEPPPAGVVLSGAVTVEMIRAKSTEYSAAPPAGFGMVAWKETCKRVTGVEKVKEIKPEMYGAFFGAMDAGLLKLKAAPAESKPVIVEKLGTHSPAAVLTKEDVKPHAKVYQDKNGEAALLALLAVFGAKKISQVDPAKYPALVEALQNA